MAKEVWKDVPGFLGYQVSDRGRVRSFRRRKYGGLRDKFVFLTPSKTTFQGHTRLKVTLFDGRTRYTRMIHRLMLAAFVGRCPKGKQGCHKDDNTLRNVLSNLYWGTPKENAQDRKRNGKQADKRGEKHHMVKLTEKEVLEIRRMDAIGVERKKIYRRFKKVSWECVRNVILRKSWTHI